MGHVDVADLEQVPNHGMVCVAEVWASRAVCIEEDPVPKRVMVVSVTAIAEVKNVNANAVPELMRRISLTTKADLS